MTNIIWKELEYGDGRFSVSNTGEVRNNITNKIYSSQVQNSGYSLVHLNFKGHRKALTIHRLVAVAFLENPDNKPQVDHIDSNKQNNSVDNLRWSTAHENMRHASASGCLKEASKGAAVRMVRIGSTYGFANSQKNLNKANPITLTIDGIKREFGSIRQASRFLNMDHRTVTRLVKEGEYS